MTILSPFVLKGTFQRARLLAQRYYKKGNEVLPTYTNAGAPTNGTSGTLAGLAEIGSLLIDTTNKVLYQNTGTLLSPTWLQVFPTLRSVLTGLTAGTTQSISGGVALTAAWNVLATVANVGDAATLPALSVGQEVVVFNRGANPAKIFPNASGIAIDSNGAGSSVTLTNAKSALFRGISSTLVLSVGGTVSA